jgi:hypothetical protein
MKKILSGLAALAALTVISISAQARDASDGCGLGWEVTSKTTFSATSTRTTTNAFVPPTFGMTSGTLGCAKHDLVKKRDEQAAFYAVENYDSLRQEMAEGSGENLQAFASLMGCSEEAYPGFTQMVRKNFSKIASDADTRLDLVVNIRHELEQNPALAASCNAI